MSHIPAVLSVLLVFTILCNFANAYSETLTVQAGSSAARSVTLSTGDKISGRIVVAFKSIKVSITDPDGRVVLIYNVTDPVDFQFTGEKAGTYDFHFENSFSETIFVTLNYNVQRYIFGFPQEYIILFVIVGLALVAIIIFVAMSPKP